MRPLLYACLLALCASPLIPRPAAGQEVGRAAIGGGLGVLGGVGVTTALVVARAKLQNRYVHEPGDLIHWKSAPLILGPAAGVAFGLAGEEALRGSVVGSVSGLVAGTAVGAGLGWLLSDDPEWRWAGGAMGGGFGMTIGGLAGGVLGWIDQEKRDVAPAAPVRLMLRVPL